MFRLSFLCALMPFFELILGFCFFYRKDKSKIDAVLKSWLVFWLGILISTEILSLFDAISRTNILFFHAVYLLSAAAAAFCNRKELRGFRFPSCGAPLFAAGIAIVLTGTFICGMTYAPDNWDSMTYHLARVASWIQNQNVDFYDTPIGRQNDQMPLAEFGILHLQLMTVSDRLAFSVQWFSFLISLMAVFRITRILGGSEKSGWFASFIAAMLPMAFFQASSTQNDLAAASFLCIFARCLLFFTPQTVVWTALAFGLSLMTKGTAYIYAAAIGLTIGGYRLLAVPKEQKKRMFFGLLLTVALGLCCSAGFAYRTLVQQEMAATAENKEFFVTSFYPGELLRNLTKHVLSHAAPPYYCTNSAVNKIAKELNTSALLNFNAHESNCPTDFNFLYFPHEDFIGNFYHLCLGVFCVILTAGIIIRKKRLKKEVIVYALAVIFAFVVFGLFIRWNPWVPRLHTAVFLLFTPITVLLLESGGMPCRKVIVIFISLLLFCTIIKSGFTESMNRRFGYPFREGTYPYQQEAELTREIAGMLKKHGIKHLGIQCGSSDRTYFIFQALDMHIRKHETMTIGYDCSAPYILSFEDISESARETPVNSELIGENAAYRIYRNKFAENPASFFPGVKFVSDGKNGIRIRQKNFPLTLDIPEPMRGKVLLLRVTADRARIRGPVFAGFSVSGNSCRFKEYPNQKNTDAFVTIPAKYTTGERIEVLCSIRRDEVCIRNVAATTAGPFVFQVFNDGKSPAAFVFYSGFSGQEKWGRWTDGEKAEFAMNIPPRFSGKSLKLTFDILSVCKKIKILAWGKVLKEVTDSPWENKIAIELPAELNSAPSLPLAFEIVEPMCKKDDPRRLGIGLKSVSLEVAEE